MANNSNRISISNDKQNKESITLLWFHSNIRSHEELIKIKIQLQLVNDYIIFYTNIKLCIKYIKSIQDEKIILIISD